MLTNPTSAQIDSLTNPTPYDTFLGVSFYGLAFDNLTTTSVAFHECRMPDTMRSCVFNKGSFNGSDFSGSNFSGSVFVNCYFDFVQARYVEFSDCMFINCSFNRTHLFQCNLTNAQFLRNYFTVCDITSPWFFSVKLEENEFTRSVFREADMSVVIKNTSTFDECRWINCNK